MPPDQPRPPPPARMHRAGQRPVDLHQRGAGVADAFVEHEVVGLQQLVELGEQVVRIDLVRLALVGGELLGALEPGVALGGEPRDPRLPPPA